jgi:flagellar hook-associated protein 2
MTGMISGMDTETLIKGIVDAQRLKNKRVEDKQTLLGWKQDKCKELNAKLYKLYTADLDKMRLKSSYMAKKVSSTNEDLVTVNSKVNAPVGSHELTIGALARSQYVTSGVIKIDADGAATEAKASTKLTGLGIEEGTLINLTSDGKTATLEVTNETTLANFVDFAKGAGYSANFDETYGRLFISAKSSGTKNAFQITATTSTATAPKNELLKLTGYSYLNAEDKKKVDAAIATLAAEEVKKEGEQSDATKAAIDKLKEFAEIEAQRIIASDVDKEIRAEVAPRVRTEQEDRIRKQVKEEYLEEHEVTEGELTDEQKKELEKLQDERIAASTNQINYAIKDAGDKAIADERAKESPNRYDKALVDKNADIEGAKNLTGTSAVDYHENSKDDQTDVSSVLQGIGLDAIRFDEDGNLIDKDGNKIDKDNQAYTIVQAEDSKITYNGVEYTNSSNVININGLELTLNGVSNGETVHLNVSNNSQGVYDTIKKFISSYNDILKEMNDLYYADSTRGYDPLSDDEKAAMTDKQIEKWEDKIKDSILRRDSTLGSLLDAMKNAMLSSVEVDGSNYSLSSFGILTSKSYSEKGLLHIHGNEDDPGYASMEDKLMKALEEDPDTVMEVMSQVSQKLYDTMHEKMKSIPNIRSAFTFYNDKEMAKQHTEYAKKIAKLEKKVIELESKYYKQFAAMESAMAKMQSQSNALAGMLGVSNK